MNRAITLEELSRQAPAATHGAAGAHMSDKYGYVDTRAVIERLMGEGFMPVAGQQDKPRSRNPNTVQHMVKLQHESLLGEELDVGASVPQLIINNSHNGRTKLRMHAGIFRFVCMNGLVVGDNTLSVELRHTRDLPSAVPEFAEKLLNNTKRLQTLMNRWERVPMPRRRQEKFAEKAAELRFGSQLAKQYAPSTILEARREEDDRETLWATFNRVQENCMKGGIRGVTANGRRTQSHQITGVQRNLSFNAQLWNLAEEFTG